MPWKRNSSEVKETLKKIMLSLPSDCRWRITDDWGDDGHVEAWARCDRTWGVSVSFKVNTKDKTVEISWSTTTFTPVSALAAVSVYQDFIKAAAWAECYLSETEIVPDAGTETVQKSQSSVVEPSEKLVDRKET